MAGETAAAHRQSLQCALSRRRQLALAVLIFLLLTLGWVAWFRVDWADHRPIGALHLASVAHVSATNPRGWFNQSEFDITGAGGGERFRAELLAYADRSIAILQSSGAQGMIVWDLEGEQHPQKVSYLGDPRVLQRAAPEMAAAADEFFGRFRAAGLKVGMTIRPQQLDLSTAPPRQRHVANLGAQLLAKIDYARSRWGATLFYVDSTLGILRPDEVVQLAWVKASRPDVLLIPEHHDILYHAFSAPYVSLEHGGEPTPGWLRNLYPRAFRVVNIADRAGRAEQIAAAQKRGDILMFRAWMRTPETELVERLRVGALQP
jgi:hypothetical protein